MMEFLRCSPGNPVNVMEFRVHNLINTLSMTRADLHEPARTAVSTVIGTLVFFVLDNAIERWAGQ